MTYYLRLNDEAVSSELPVIASFTEDFLEDGTRQMNLGIKIENPAATDALSTKFLKFYVDNSITSLSIVNENETVVYLTKAYTELGSISLQLNLDQVQEDEDFGLNTPISYNLMLKA